MPDSRLARAGRPQARGGTRHTLSGVSSQDADATGRPRLPATGPGSHAGLGRRLVAVVVDWLLCVVIASAVFRVPVGATGGAAFLPLAIFAAENLLLLSTTGGTVGHRLLGLRVGALGRPTLGLVQVLVRTVLLCLFVPAVVWDRDGRGLHDRAAGTVIVRR